MIQDIFPRKFDNQYKNISPTQNDILVAFKGSGRRDDAALIKLENDTIAFPTVGEFWDISEKLIYIFSIDSTNFFLCMDEITDTKGYSYEITRSFRLNNPGYLCFAGMTAYHLFVWYRDSQYCGRCGHKTEHDSKERMMKCPHCNNMIFPKIAPAVIIGLRDNNRLLMSRYAGREYKGRALLAGFCEIGETPEETVVREVLEEVGLKCKNVTYFGSQPWGFDSNLLLGYYADLDGDDKIRLDEEELAIAEFVDREEIEYDPHLMSLTATMIETFRLGKDK